MKSSLLVLTALCLGLSGLQAQTKPDVQVKVSAPKVINIQTPVFQANNAPSRNWRPKDWLEIDTELQIKLPTAAGRNASLPQLTINYFVALNAQTKDGKFHLLKGTINYVDVPENDRVHALAYITPSTLRRILQRDNFTSSSDVKASAVELVVDGQVVAGETTVPGRWWEKTDSFIATENVVLPRKETPFDILWGDYDLPTKAK